MMMKIIQKIMKVNKFIYNKIITINILLYSLQ
jgi:hypothetical protein